MSTLEKFTPKEMDMTAILCKQTRLKCGLLVETMWSRVPMIDSPEAEVCRRSNIERLDRDPLSLKQTTLYNKQHKPVACVGYLESATEQELKQAHELIVSAIEAGILTPEDEKNRFDLWLRDQFTGTKLQKMINRYYGQEETS